MTEGMTSTLSAKLNKIFKMKQLLKQMEDELKPMIEEIKQIALQGARADDGNWHLENGVTRACVSTTIRVQESAVEYLQKMGRDDLISVKPYVKVDALAQVMGEEEMTTKGLATYTYALKVTEKK